MPSATMNHVDIDSLTAALVQFSSASRLYALRLGDAGPAGDLLVEAFAASDLVGGLGWRDVIVVSLSATVDLQALLGQAAQLDASLADGTRTTFGGYVTAAAALGSNGGLARYRLRISPWLWRLTQARNSRVWQDKSALEIVDEVLGAYQPLARWRWSEETAPFMQHAATRSYRCQYRESDYDFVQRVLAEEGLLWRFEDTPDGPCMVLFSDSRELCAVSEDATSAALGGVALHGAGSVQRHDAVQAMRACRRVGPSSATVLSYDYRTKSVLHASAPARLIAGAALPPLEAFDTPGQYAFASSAQARRYADLQMEGLEARTALWQGRSTVRTLRAGTRLNVTGLPRQSLSEAGFTVLRVHSVGVNNMPAPVRQALAELFGPIPELLAECGHGERPEEDALVVTQAVQTGYANTFDAVTSDVVWRPQLPDSAGRSRAKPTALGAQSARVVGADGQDTPAGGDELYCDRLGRVRIRFHWQEQAASCWVRVAQRSAGGGMGSQFLPRIGMEVMVQFIENDIDRPIIVGALYNGQGEGGIRPTPGGAEGDGSGADPFKEAHDHAPSGQGNLAGGNSPLWHGAAPDSAAHRNGAAQWGLRSKEFGGAGYSQLLFDDTDAQGRVQLRCSHAGTELNLGHLVHTADNYRGSLRGAGAELRTDHYGALRAGAGLLVSSYAIKHAAAERDPAGESGPVIAMLKQAATVCETFSKAAATHHTVALAAHVGAARPAASVLNEQAAPLKAMLTAVSGMVGADSLEQATADAEARVTTPDPDKLPHLGAPVIAVAAKAGLGVAAGQSVQLSNGETVTLLSGQDSQFVSGGQLRLHTGQAIGVLAGAVAPGDAGVGLQMIAATDSIEVQAQSDALNVQARDEVNVMSTNAHIDWAAAKSISLSTAGGASLTIEGGNIRVQCPGKIAIHAGRKIFSGPERMQYPLPHLPQAPAAETDLEFRHFTEWGAPLGGRAFRATLSDGTVRKGQLDADGYARIAGVAPGTTARIEYLHDTSALVSHVDTEIDPDLFEFFDLNAADADGDNDDDAAGAHA